MTERVDVDYLKFIRAELMHRRDSRGHNAVDLDWIISRLQRGITGEEAEPIQGMDPEAERKLYSEDRQRVGLVGASNLSASRRLRASLGTAEYTFMMDATDKGE